MTGAPIVAAPEIVAPAVAAAKAVDTRRGLVLGFVGVAIFAATLPMTRLAVGSEAAPLMSGTFVAFGRAAVAGLLSIAYLALSRAPWPARRDWLAIAAVSGGVVFGFPFFTSVAMRHVEAVHAAVVIGLLPLATALVGAWLHRQRPSPGFWLCAGLGSALVVAFAVWRSGTPGLSVHPADGLLAAAVACAAVGYGVGGRLAQRMRAEHVIGWALVLALPVTLPVGWLARPVAAVPAGAWWAFGYVAVFSMWIGFFAWYRGLALGGTVRVSQVQLAQPFLSMLFAVPLLGERIDAATIGFALAVIATVFVGRKMPVRAAPPMEEAR